MFRRLTSDRAASAIAAGSLACSEDLVQMRLGRGVHRSGLEHAELQNGARPVLERGGLLHRSSEAPDREALITALSGRPAGRDQDGCGPWIAAGRCREEMSRDALCRHVSLHENRSGPRVQLCSAVRADPLLDGVAHQGVDECQVPAREHQVDIKEAVGGIGSNERIQPGDADASATDARSPRIAAASATWTHASGNSAKRRRRCGRIAPPASDLMAATDGSAASPASLSRSSLRYSGLPTGHLVGRRRQLRIEEPPRRAVMSSAVAARLNGAGLEDRRVRLAEERRDGRVGRGVFAGPDRVHDRDRQSVEPPRQEREPAERRRISPVEVVDEDGHRPPFGEGRQRPVQGVDRLEAITSAPSLVRHG